MTDLERALVSLGRELELPEAPEVTARVVARLDRAPRRSWRRPLVVALGLLALAIGIAFAVPPARSAILDWLGVAGVSIERVEQLPEPVGDSLGLGARTTLAEAQRRADYPVLVPDALGPPAEVWFTAAFPGGQVGLVWRLEDPVLLSQFRADGLRFIEKSAGPGTRVEHVSVGDAPGVWVTGEPHFFAYVSPGGEIVEQTTRLAGDVLLWMRGGVTLRLEGAASKAEALRIAASAREP